MRVKNLDRLMEFYDLVESGSNAPDATLDGVIDGTIFVLADSVNLI
jgi:hypothetical protein